MFHPVPEIVFQAKKYIRLLDIKNLHFCSNSTNIWRYWPHSPLPHIVNIKVIKSHSLNLRNGLNLYLKYIIIVQVRYRKLILLWMKMYQISGETKMSSTKYWTIEILILETNYLHGFLCALRHVLHSPHWRTTMTDETINFLFTIQPSLILDNWIHKKTTETLPRLWNIA